MELSVSRRLGTSDTKVQVRLVAVREMYVDGLVGIANGDNPRIIESRLLGYVV